MEHQNWDPVTWKKPAGFRFKGETAAEAKRRALRSSGTAVQKKHGSEEAARLHKLEHNAHDDDGVMHKPKTVTRAFSAQLQSARLAKSLTQKALAAQINEKPTVINDYESGKAVPSQQVVQKLNRVLGIQLVSNKRKDAK